MTTNDRGRHAVALLFLLALLACTVTVLGGVTMAGVYTPREPFLRAHHMGVQHLRPLHETFSFVWILLAGAAFLHRYAFDHLGPWSVGDRHRFSAMAWLWIVAGLGTVVSLLLGHGSGREYFAAAPGLALGFLGGWLLMAWNWFRRVGWHWQDAPAQVWCWSCALLLFPWVMVEGHAWLLDVVGQDPIRDARFHAHAVGGLVGVADLLVLGALIDARDRESASAEVGRSGLAFQVFFLTVARLIVDRGHDALDVSAPWPQGIGAALAAVHLVWLIRLLAGRAGGATDPSRTTPGLAYSLRRAALGWTVVMGLSALVLALPSFHRVLQGTQVVVFHTMGCMIGMDTLILWSALAGVIAEWKSASDSGWRRQSLRWSLPLLHVLLAGFLGCFLVRGLVLAELRMAGPAASDWSEWLAAWPFVMVNLGHTLGSVLLWILALWIADLVRALRRSTPATTTSGA